MAVQGRDLGLTNGAEEAVDREAKAVTETDVGDDRGRHEIERKVNVIARRSASGKRKACRRSREIV